ncbi:MAG: glycosyltransferase family 9 protein [Candidatus Hydrogenedentes bacterium]|nr:glycosyltransferase family 9 protein [Candidatus Hydrogenedentota bacterium]
MARKRILVAQMTRMGDVLQTSPLIRALKQREPESHITVMVRRMGKSIAECNPDINDILVHEEDEVFRDLQSDDPDRLLKVYGQTDAYIAQLREGRYDIAYNCTHSLCSAMLLKLAGIPEVIGAHLSEDWRYVWRGRGPNYFITSVLHREANDLNLCDSFRHFMQSPPVTNGLVLEVNAVAHAEAMSILAANGIGDDGFVVCFQLGASDRDKRWPEAQFAALAKVLVARNNARIVLLGVSEEAALGVEFERHAPGVAAHLFGKTTIPQLAAILKRARVLVTNDTGTMHIAAAVQCPIVLVSVGYVHFRETGPYGAGHYAVELAREDVGRSDLRGRDAGAEHLITDSHVASAVEFVVSKDDVPVAMVPLEGVEVFRSEFAPDGCLQWYPVARRNATHSDIVRMAYRPMWLEDFRGKSTNEIERDCLENLANHYAAPADSACWSTLNDALSGLANIGDRGETITRELIDTLRRPGEMRQAKHLVSMLMALDEELRVYAEIHSSCKPLVATARFDRENLEGSDPALLAARTLDIYKSLCTRARSVAEKLDLLHDVLTR